MGQHAVRERAQLATQCRDAPTHAVQCCFSILQATHGSPKLVSHSVNGDEDQALNRHMEVSSDNVEELADHFFSARSGFGPDVAKDS